MSEALSARVTRLWSAISATSDPEFVVMHLLDRYREPHRYFHTLDHLRYCLRQFDTVPIGALEHREAVEIAAIFHDVIYAVNPGQYGDNEIRSADYATHVLSTAGVDVQLISRVHGLIMATTHHQPPVDNDHQFLVDTDISWFGLPWNEFADNIRRIRQEFYFVPNEVFWEKNTAIYRLFLDRPKIYRTNFFAQRLESQAQNNLTRQIAWGEEQSRYHGRKSWVIA